jgi:hypothetical protein
MRIFRPHGAVPDRRGVCRRVKCDFYVFEAAVPHASATRVHSLALRVADRHVVLHNTTQHKQAAASETHSAMCAGPINASVSADRMLHSAILLTKSFHAGASQKPPNPKKQLSPAAMRNAPTRSVKFLVSPCCDAHRDAEPIRTHTVLAIGTSNGFKRWHRATVDIAACQCWSSWPGSQTQGSARDRTARTSLACFLRKSMSLIDSFVLRNHLRAHPRHEQPSPAAGSDQIRPSLP